MRSIQTRTLLAIVAVSSLCGLLISPVTAQDWARFRGTDGQGLGTIQNLPSSWTDADYNWKIELPGGHSSPVVWQDRIYLSGGDDESGTRTFVCIDAKDGSQLWSKSYPSTTYRKHAFNSYASGTAGVDEAGVYFTWATPEAFTVLALSHDGEERWTRNLGPFVSQHGGGLTPTLHEGRVFIFVDPDEKDGSGSFVTALNANSGETLWTTTHQSSVTNYSVPLIYQPAADQPAQLIVNSMAQGVTAYDPETGKQLWQIKDVDGQPLLNLRSVSSPYIAGGLLIASCGSGGGGNSLVAVRPPASPDGNAEMVYRIARSAPYVPTTICKDDLLFLFDDAGVATCIDVASGDVHWRKRLGGGIFSSPVCSDDRLFCVSTTGEVVVLSASEEFEELGRNNLDETCHASPAIADGRLYVRTYRHLYSLGGAK